MGSVKTNAEIQAIAKKYGLALPSDMAPVNEHPTPEDLEQEREEVRKYRRAHPGGS